MNLTFIQPTPTQGQMTTTIDTTTTTIADFDTWCDFITDGLDQIPNNGDLQQALNDDKEYNNEHNKNLNSIPTFST